METWHDSSTTAALWVWKSQIKRFCFSWFVSRAFTHQSLTYVSPLPAKLLRKGHHHRVPEEDRDLLEASHRCQRRDHLRLQIPTGGEQDPLPVWNRELPRNTQLAAAPLSLPHSPTGMDRFDSSDARTGLRANLQTKPPSPKPARADSNAAVLTVPRKQETHTLALFTHICHSHGSFTSQHWRCWRSPPCEHYEGGAVRKRWSFCGSIVGLNRRKLSVFFHAVLLFPRQSQFEGIQWKHWYRASASADVVSIVRHSARVKQHTHTDAQEHSTNSGFLKALVHCAILRLNWFGLQLCKISKCEDCFGYFFIS